MPTTADATVPPNSVADRPSAVPITVVDAFTATRFSGNPAAVCVLDSWPDDGWLGDVAAEMNLAETAFVVAREEIGEYDLRWFTPTVEADLCGHATLAATHVLDREGPVRFHTRSGVLTCVRRGAHIELDFPAAAGVSVSVDPRLVEALGARVRTAQDGMFLLVEVADEATVRELTPDIAALGALHPLGVIVTAAGDGAGGGDGGGGGGGGGGAGDGRFDCVSRVFVPNAGIPEDPVTGSAHCQLALFWGARLGRDELLGYQASRRGGEVGMRIDGDRVVLSGTVVTVLTGTLAR